MLPLAGVTVLALEQAVAAPLATRQLADMGARVIKVERPGSGDFARGYDGAVRGLSSHFVWLNRSKESLTLNIKHVAARDILYRLIEQADIFVQNLAPGAASRLGLDADRLRERNARLIVCNISGYGQEGPYRDKKAYDLLVQCETGLVATTGTPDTPCKVGIAVADIAAGMYAFSGLLAALLQRERGGIPQVLDISLFDALAEWMAYPAYFTDYGGTPPARTGASHATIMPYGPFACGDGTSVLLGIQNEREWRRFCERVLEQPALAGDRRFATNADRVRYRTELGRIIETVFAASSGQDVIARLDAAQIANARLNSVAEFVEHPQLLERGRWTEVGTPAGTVKAMYPPWMPAGGEVRMDPVPDVGEHTAAILRELGRTDAEIAVLRDQGAI
jgi:crotonobetainyl-CoA:carnitine CoA-transferase CaiB-like acyl-CoA transferase